MHIQNYSKYLLVIGWKIFKKWFLGVEMELKMYLKSGWFVHSLFLAWLIYRSLINGGSQLVSDREIVLLNYIQPTLTLANLTWPWHGALPRAAVVSPKFHWCEWALLIDIPSLTTSGEVNISITVRRTANSAWTACPAGFRLLPCWEFCGEDVTSVRKWTCLGQEQAAVQKVVIHALIDNLFFSSTLGQPVVIMYSL